MVKGFVLSCNGELNICEIVFNGFGENIEHLIQTPLPDICDPLERPKMGEFIESIREKGAVFNWEINVNLGNNIKPLKFSGSLLKENFIIIGLETNNDVPFLFDELMKINNEQTNYIRSILKENFNDRLTEEEQSSLDELSKLNNEMANLQRELAKKNAELKKLNDLKNQFLGMAAHDLRNPLGNILNYSEFLMEETANLNEEQIEFIEDIRSRSEFMLKLVDDLLDVSSIESGDVSLFLDSVDLRDLISKVVKLNQTVALSKNITIEFFPPEEAAELSIDASKIEQTLTNLITNAIKFSPNGTKVQIFLEIKEGVIKVSVKDQGRGIPETEIDKLFKPFGKTSTASTGGEKSTGLGLFIVRRIIEAHQGEIWLESELNRGSVFHFTLPFEGK